MVCLFLHFFFSLIFFQTFSCIHGNGNNKRSFIYVQDTVNAFDVILHQGHIGQIYNIGTSEERSNLQVAKDLIKIFGLQDREKEFITFVENRLFNDFRYSMSSEKLRNLGWKQEISWEEGLKLTGTFAFSFLLE